MEEDNDPLRAARGSALGAVLGIGMWLILIGLVVVAVVAAHYRGG